MANIKRRSFIGGLFASTLAFLTPFSRQEKIVAKEIVKKDYKPTRREQNKLAKLLRRNRYSGSNISRIIKENRTLRTNKGLSLDQIRHLTLDERDILLNEKKWHIWRPVLDKVRNRLIPKKPNRCGRGKKRSFLVIPSDINGLSAAPRNKWYAIVDHIIRGNKDV